MNIERLTTPWWALRVTLGAVAFLAGLDKFFNLLADWGGYLNPTITEAGVGAEALDRAAAHRPLSNPAAVKIVSVILLGMAFATAPALDAFAQTNSGKATATLSTASALKQDLRKLWTDHVVWTRDYVVAAVGDQPDAAAAANRLMRNQEDIGKAIATFYGAPVGEQLTTLLKQHIAIAVDLIKAAKAGDKAGQQQADTKWQQNAVDIADFLSKANPNWPKASLVDMMKTHLSTTTNEVVARLTKNWDEDVRSFDAVYEHILHMSDALADGIVKQFPNRFSDGSAKPISR